MLIILDNGYMRCSILKESGSSMKLSESMGLNIRYLSSKFRSYTTIMKIRYTNIKTAGRYIILKNLSSNEPVLHTTHVYLYL
jgi:hypothetical protein